MRGESFSYWSWWSGPGPPSASPPPSWRSGRLVYWSYPDIGGELPRHGILRHDVKLDVVQREGLVSQHEGVSGHSLDRLSSSHLNTRDTQHRLTSR